jgi:hypothetical protein
MSPDKLYERWILIYGLIKKLNLKNSDIHKKAFEIHNIKYRKFTDKELKASMKTPKGTTVNKTMNKTQMYCVPHKKSEIISIS